MPARMRAARPLDAPRVGGPLATASFAPIPEPTVPPYAVNGRLFVKQGRGKGFCSATAIASATRRLVLTAAHCLDVANGRNFETAQPNQLEVFFGPELGDPGTGEQVADALIHEGYDRRALGVNDLGLIWLQNPAAAKKFRDLGINTWVEQE